MGRIWFIVLSQQPFTSIIINPRATCYVCKRKNTNCFWWVQKPSRKFENWNLAEDIAFYVFLLDPSSSKLN